MPAFLLNLLPLVKKFKTPLLWALLAAVVFGAGWKVNGWRLESKYEAEAAAIERAVREELLAREAALREQYTQDLRRIAEARDLLSANLAVIREENAALTAEIESSTTLVKPSDVTCIDNETGIAHENQPNPFSDDFVRLWNDAGRVRDQ